MLIRRDASVRRDRRVAGLLLVVYLVLFAFGVQTLRPWEAKLPLSNDFISFWTGAVLVRDGAGASLFDMDAQSQFQASLRQEMTGSAEMSPGVVLDPFHSPPVQGLLLVPLTALPFTVAYLATGALSLLAILLAVALPLRGYEWGASAAILMVSFAAVADTLLFGQVNAEFVLALSLAMLAMRSGKPFVGGALLGVLWLKPQYAVLFPLLFVIKGRWREFLGMAATGGVLAAVSLMIVGLDGATSFIRVLSEIGAFYPPNDAFIFPQAMVNWRGVLVHVWPGIPGGTGSALIGALGAATGGLALLSWRGEWDPASSRFPRQMLALTVAAVLTAPHSNFHGMVLLLAPVAFVVAGPSTHLLLRRVWFGLALLVYLLSLAIWPFKVNSWLLVAPLMLGIAILVAQTRVPSRSHNEVPTVA